MKLDKCSIYEHTSKCDIYNCYGCPYNKSKQEEKRYKYKININCEETRGTIELTKKQALLVNYVADTNNWQTCNGLEINGLINIDIDNPSEMTDELKKFLLSSEDYKDFTYLKEEKSLIRLLEDKDISSKNISLIQLNQIDPVRDDKNNIIDIIGFVGQCVYKDGKITSLDGDTYNPKMKVYGYEFFEYKTKDKKLYKGIDILVGEDW